MAAPQIAISFRLPPAVALEMRQRVEALASPSAIRQELSNGDVARAAVDLFILWARAEMASEAPPPIPRQRSRVLPVPSQPIARRATAG